MCVGEGLPSVRSCASAVREGCGPATFAAPRGVRDDDVSC